MKNKGIYLALATAVISGFAVFLNKFASNSFGDPYIFTTAKNIGVALILFSIILMPKFYKQIKALSKKQWLYLLLIGIIGGSIPFLMFFKGLTMVSSGNAALIHKTLFIWVGILAVIFLKEKLGRLQIAALVALLAGNILLSGLKGWQFGVGDGLIFGATLFWAIESILAKKVLENLSSEIVAWGRMFFGSIFLFGFLGATGRAGSLFSLDALQLKWLLISCALLFVYVFTWYKALKYERASVVAVALVPASLITTLLNSIFITGAFSLQQLIVSCVFAGGVLVFYNFRPKKAYEFAAEPTK